MKVLANIHLNLIAGGVITDKNGYSLTISSDNIPANAFAFFESTAQSVINSNIDQNTAMRNIINSGHLQHFSTYMKNVTIAASEYERTTGRVFQI